MRVMVFLRFLCSGSGILIVPLCLGPMPIPLIREDERERESGEEPRGMKREAEKEPPWVRF